jgi:TPR repeat protein
MSLLAKKSREQGRVNVVNHLLTVIRQSPFRGKSAPNWGNIMAIRLTAANNLFDVNLAAAARGDAQAYFDLGMAFSTGTEGAEVDMIEAHKWFNLAALAGVREGSQLRTEIAAEMSREEIAEAQRAARAWIQSLSGNEASRRAA